MTGDKFNIRTNSWYKLNGATPGTPVNPLTDLLAALTGSVGSISSTHGGATVAELQSSGVLSPGATSFLSSQTVGAGKPKAYLNWILFDEQFKYVSPPPIGGGAGGSSGFEQVGNDQEFKTHLFNDKPIDKSGYLYVYVSNETPNIDVFFDNLQVTHVRGALLEETHYYPFGLIQQGISSKAFEAPANTYQYQGSYSTFEDETGYNDFQLRNYDAQIGRWIQPDPYDEYPSGYSGMGDNPVSNVDPDGGCVWCETAEKTLTLKEVVVTAIRKAPKVAEQSFSLASRLINGGFWSGVLDVVQTGIDIVGLIPVVGEIADGANALIYTARGDYTNAALSAAAMIPIAGWGATGGKFVNKALKFTKDQQALVDIAKNAKKMGGVTEAEAKILKEWADEYNIPFRGPEAHPNRNFNLPHIHVGPVDHIIVK